MTDIVYNSATLLSTQSLNVKPSNAADHWVIHNINIPFGSTCELYHSDGTNTVLIMTTSTSLLSYNFHCSTLNYYIIKNIGASSINVAFDGVAV